MFRRSVGLALENMIALIVPLARYVMTINVRYVSIKPLMMLKQ